MKKSVETGISFGLTSGVITTLGLMVGLNAGTHSQVIVVGGILTIAIADAFSDAMGIHVSEESKRDTNQKDVWESTISTLVSKLIFALTFVVPVILLELETAIIISIVWGLLILSIYSYRLAKLEGIAPYKVIGEHIFIAVLVILLTNFAGDWIANNFGEVSY